MSDPQWVPRGDRTEARDHLIHALALIALDSWPRTAPAPAWLRPVDIVPFPCSLYAMKATGFRRLSAIPSLGGLSFMAGWAALAVAATKDPGQPGQ